MGVTVFEFVVVRSEGVDIGAAVVLPGFLVFSGLFPALGGSVRVGYDHVLPNIVCSASLCSDRSRHCHYCFLALFVDLDFLRFH